MLATYLLHAAFPVIKSMMIFIDKVRVMYTRSLIFN